MKAELIVLDYAPRPEIRIRVLGQWLLIVPCSDRNIIGTSSLETWPLAIDTFAEVA